MLLEVGYKLIGDGMIHDVFDVICWAVCIDIFDMIIYGMMVELLRLPRYGSAFPVECYQPVNKRIDCQSSSSRKPD